MVEFVFLSPTERTLSQVEWVSRIILGLWHSLCIGSPTTIRFRVNLRWLSNSWIFWKLKKKSTWRNIHIETSNCSSRTVQLDTKLVTGVWFLQLICAAYLVVVPLGFPVPSSWKTLGTWSVWWWKKRYASSNSMCHVDCQEHEVIQGPDRGGEEISWVPSCTAPSRVEDLGWWVIDGYTTWFINFIVVLPGVYFV